MQWIFFIEKPVLSVGQFNRLSNIFDNGGQVIFGAAVLSPFISGIASINILVIILGGIGALLCWVLSVWLAKRGEEL
ncbi:MAG: hypothetical protein A3D74_00910 [Candidatus Levybacteria bacterium RIFCSPHIGHO2_02_FULL_37_13]|nr:MAG: hypothetical protein A3D74_00910 [Candidatus Levybacteria bacterium RIFCSPHIGHO2_02_FULL_37_13]OGH30496.1 MAG: hypothetical protein A3E40_04315 [Candidatus Levybacteria bacterium RIFCSPHIGHO2_12_FULL_37_9]